MRTTCRRCVLRREAGRGLVPTRAVEPAARGFGRSTAEISGHFSHRGDGGAAAVIDPLDERAQPARPRLGDAPAAFGAANIDVVIFNPHLRQRPRGEVDIVEQQRPASGRAPVAIEDDDAVGAMSERVVARGGAEVQIGADVAEAMAASRDWVQEAVAGQPGRP